MSISIANAVPGPAGQGTHHLPQSENAGKTAMGWASWLSRGGAAMSRLASRMFQLCFMPFILKHIMKHATNRRTAETKAKAGKTRNKNSRRAPAE
ncbi:hypothetical protein [Janthinobacterium sp. YR213]|uniref:hypothetical protein n=1 Tax=Janthinobacterium sp. YR213 TaxID=1881027 RepID=UPI0011142496|nr:hypothetical protein [Janthinobacterium sp. YR213]